MHLLFAASLTTIRAQSDRSPKVVYGEHGQVRAGPQVWGGGPLTSDSFQITRDYSFLDYILGGCQLMFTVRFSTTLPHATSPLPSEDPPEGLELRLQQERLGIDFRKDLPRAWAVSGPEERV